MRPLSHRQLALPKRQFQARQPDLTAGFSLIELLIVMAVVGILIAVSMPSYRAYIERAQRASAKVTLLDAAQFMERYRSNNFSYADSNGNPPSLPAALVKSPAQGAKRYDISLSVPSPNAFVLTATPSAWQDRLCGNLTLDNLGIKGQSTGDAAVCWNR